MDDVAIYMCADRCCSYQVITMWNENSVTNAEYYATLDYYRDLYADDMCLMHS